MASASDPASIPALTPLQDNLERLRRLVMPPLAGKSFLDVRCREGLACGFAVFDGAREVSGLDEDPSRLATARAAVPQGRFEPLDWQRLPPGPFDVILLAGGLHLTEDPNAIVRELLARLSEDGTLVVELAITRIKPKKGSKFGLRLPTMPQLADVFRGGAWKQMGASLATADEGIRWHVVHLRRRLPFAYLLMQPPAQGKSSIARELFAPAGVTVVSGDRTISLVAQGKLEAPDELGEAMRADFSSATIDRTIHRIFESGLGERYLRFLLEQGRGSDFALDAFLPADQHAQVVHLARELGYVPVRLEWESPYRAPMGLRTMSTRVDGFTAALEAQGARPPASFPAAGYVDRVAPRTKTTIVRGWAFDQNGDLPRYFAVTLDGQRYVPQPIHPREREDVQRNFGLPHAHVGFEFRVPTTTNLETLEVRCGSGADELGAPLRLSSKALR